MNNEDYVKVIIDSLLKKYNARCAKGTITNRRIVLKPTQIYKDYNRNNAEIVKKQLINEAASALSNMEFVAIDYLKFSDDIEKIYLAEERIQDIYAYLEKEYGIVPQSAILKQVQKIVMEYTSEGKIAKAYCDTVLAQLKEPGCLLEPERVEANLKMFRFLENNRGKLFIREASMLVYGDSKWFEENNYEEVCTFLRNVTETNAEESGRKDTVLGLFHVVPAEQEIFIKGNWKIEWEGYILEVAKLHGGIAIASGDMQSIKRITVDVENIITIENKASYQRMKDSNSAMMYLGGFANRHQIDFLKKVIFDNPDARYQHFGDIDIGGFLIHRHLCRETSKSFHLYCMGIQQLKDKRFSNCLRELTNMDIARMETLMEDTLYCEILEYMKENNVKLEQEIVSYYLDKEIEI